MDYVGNVNKDGESLAINEKNYNQNENGTSLNRFDFFLWFFS